MSNEQIAWDIEIIRNDQLQKKRREKNPNPTAVQEAMPSAPLTTAALPPTSAPPMATLSPPTDIELALFMIQEQEEEMKRRLETLTPGSQQYPVV